jgi:hypothetical protein
VARRPGQFPASIPVANHDCDREIATPDRRGRVEERFVLARGHQLENIIGRRRLPTSGNERRSCDSRARPVESRAAICCCRKEVFLPRCSNAIRTSQSGTSCGSRAASPGIGRSCSRFSCHEAAEAGLSRVSQTTQACWQRQTSSTCPPASLPRAIPRSRSSGISALPHHSSSRGGVRF